MDLLDLIRNQIKALPSGDHLPGLQAVLQHIEVAYKHFAQGQSGNEDAFTDTVYRTNMAFEGSIKEAYRVLTSSDPSKLRPYDIEKYLEQEGIFRDRIVGQFSGYRTDWRNPASHDYNLSFDENEAFMAIVSVSAFTKVLVDEIAERLSFAAVKKDIKDQQSSKNIEPHSSEPLIDQVSSALANFAKYYNKSSASAPIESEAQLMGAIAGYLTSVLPNAQITTGRLLQGSKPHYADVMVTSGEVSVIIELKRGVSPSLVRLGQAQLLDYLAISNAKFGVLFLHSDKSLDYEVETVLAVLSGSRIDVVRPT
jgi:hypothetical protein